MLYYITTYHDAWLVGRRSQDPATTLAGCQKTMREGEGLSRRLCPSAEMVRIGAGRKGFHARIGKDSGIGCRARMRRERFGKRRSQGDDDLLIEDLDELDDAGMRAQPTQGLNLPQVVHLLLALEGALHALDGGHLPVLHALGLQNLGKGALALFRNETVFCEAKNQRMDS